MAISNATIAANSNKTIVVNSNGTDVEWGGYIHRGDPNTFDFFVENFTADGAWHTLSLAAIIPANAKLVHLRMRIKDDVTGRDFYIRKTGLANAVNVHKLGLQAANIPNEANDIIDCTGQRIDYWLTSATWTEVALVVLGWII